MKLEKEILKQINNITTQLISKSLIVAQNYPILDNNEIKWKNYKNIVFSLKKEPYDVIYKNCIMENDYNFILIDGAIIQMLYRFDKKGNNLIEHILRFMPHPDFEIFENNPEFESWYYGDELFSEIIERKIVTFPIRFDFSNNHKNIVHPYVHATLGDYESCRIPVIKPISPYKFISFILRNFYFSKFFELKLDSDFKDKLKFDETITIEEKKLLYISYID